LIRIPQEVIRRVRAEAPERDLALEADATLDITQSREFFADFKEELQMNRVRLPSLGQSAARVHRLLSATKVSAPELTAAISMDPAISVKLLKIANSTLFNSESRVQDLDSLVARLGIFSTREIAACFAFRDVYKNSSPELVSRLAMQVTQSQQVSALAAAIAEVGGVIDPKVASLAGLLSNVGVLPIFSYSMHNVAYAMNPELVDRAIKKMSRHVGVLLAKKWRFGDELIACIDNAENWSYACGDKADLASTVICANYHYVLSCSGFKSLPKPKDVPSITAAVGGSLSEKVSLNVLGRAKELMNGKAVA
jgi:HD-like signal output (HDOD) protein